MSMLNDDIIKSMLNSKDKENLFVTAIVYSLSPLQVKLYPGDNAIPVKSLTGSIGITTGSNVLMLRHQSKYIIVGVIGDPGEASGSSSPAGSITQFGGSSTPSGWLLCNGSAVSRSTYSNLFTVIGTTYGVGDGSTTFNLPNLKGKVPVGYNSS